MVILQPKVKEVENIYNKLIKYRGEVQEIDSREKKENEDYQKMIDIIEKVETYSKKYLELEKELKIPKEEYKSQIEKFYNLHKDEYEENYLSKILYNGI